jgi:hypothetical protein
VSFIIGLANILLIAALAWFGLKRVDPDARSHFLPGLIFRLASGIGIGLIYIAYYPGGDTFIFFEDAVKLTQAVQREPARVFDFLFTGSPAVTLINDQPRSIFFINVVACINFMTGSNYWLSSLWLSLFSFAGSWYLIAKLTKAFPDARMITSTSFLFFPSVILWSSGVMKESLAFGALCMLSGFCFGLFDRQTIRRWEYLIVPVAAFLLLNLKYYWAAVFFPAALTGLLIDRISGNSKWGPARFLITWIVSFCAMCLAVSFLHPNFHLTNFLAVVKENHDAFVEFSAASLYIHYYQLEASWFSLVLNSPWALVSGLFRPFLFEARTVMQIFGGVENLILLVLFLFQWSKLQVLEGSYRVAVVSMLGYILVLCIFLALATPNFGTLSRYRIGFLPFFLFLLLMNRPGMRGRSFRKIIKRVSQIG